MYNVIYENSAPEYGGGVLAHMGSSMLLSNNTIVKNRCTENRSQGGGVIAIGINGIIGKIEGVNNIIYDNASSSDPECSEFSEGIYSFTYTCCKRSISGTGNITSSPRFVNAGIDDFRLRENSSCIDAGDPGSPKDPDDTRADMGALYFHQGTDIKTTLTESKKGPLITSYNTVNGTVKLIVTIPDGKDAQLTIVNSQGRTIRAFTVRKGLRGYRGIPFSIKGIPPGAYYAYILIDNRVFAEILGIAR